jgi:hypothetical protein
VASYYVYSGAGGAGTGADWANAFTTLAGAFSGKAAGDIFYVADDHAESQASAMTLTSPGTNASPCFVYCVLRSGGSVPPVSADLRTTATITTTGANTITLAQQTTYLYGIIFSVGTGAVTSNFVANAGGMRLFFEACALRKAGTSAATSALNFSGGSGAIYALNNTTVQFGNTGDAINVGSASLFRWTNTSSAVTGATIPTTGLFSGLNGYTVLCEGVDLSALGSSSTIIRASTSGGLALLKDCKLGSSVTIAATPTDPMSSISLIRGDSGDTNYRTERYHYTGTLTTETTIVRTGGASDGTTPISWKVITTANSERIYPFEAFPISIWNETVGSSVTVTVECRGAAIPNMDEMWMDVEFLGTSGFPLGNFSTTGHADLLATGTANTSSSESWGGSTSSFKLVATITPQEKGPITCHVKVAKVSSTFYIDPKITLS